MAKKMYVAKNVSMELKNFHTIYDYAEGKKLNFSAALNKIVSEWDDLSVEINKWKEKLNKKAADLEVEQLKKAKVVQ